MEYGGRGSSGETMDMTTSLEVREGTAADIACQMS